MIDAQRELDLLLRARHPFVAVRGADEARIEGFLRASAERLRMPFYIWSVTRGMRVAGSLAQPTRGKTLDEALDVVRRQPGPGLYLFLDLQAWWEEPATLRSLLDVGRYLELDHRALVVAGPGLTIPERLRHLCAIWDLPLPRRDELHTLAQRVIRDLGSHGPVQVHLDAAGLNRLVDNLHGLSGIEAERALCAAIADDLALTEGDLEGVLEAKRRVLQEGGALEYIVTETGLGDVGGLANLKAWLLERRDAFGERARAFGLPPPKGLVLLGVQGCGKSLAAKAIASSWGLPLLRMEAGRIYDKFIGESDKNLEQALRAAEHMAPCVLMIDEIEKAFAYAGSTDSDGGLSRRLFGRLLGWLQDRPAPVFVVATCNDVSQLPPEFIRKGRFDEIFFVDLPTPSERRAIFDVHLRRRGRDSDTFDLEALAKHSAGFSGAEIEQAIVGALYSAFSAGADLTTEGVIAELRRTRPLSVTRAEDVAALRAWAAGRTVPAGASA
ncbi:MAG: AAA family ATPase [Planctomycetota bacterium]|nr:AAA family ATPase [Planctomycetota bacterium]